MSFNRKRDRTLCSDTRISISMEFHHVLITENPSFTLLKEIRCCNLQFDMIGLFSRFLLLTTLISGLSAAVCFPLSGVPIRDLLLTTFLLLINSWSLVLFRSLPPSKGADSILTSMFNRLHSVPFGSYRSQTCDSYYNL